MEAHIEQYMSSEIIRYADENHICYENLELVFTKDEKTALEKLQF